MHDVGAGVTPTVADHVARFLVDRGVEMVFGLCGHTNISVLAAIERLGAPRFVTARHEQVAAHAADGLARASGRPGVLLVHVGPGMTNAATGVATAAFDSIPLVVIAGDVPSYYEGRGPHQEFNLRRDADQVSVYEPFVKRAWRVRRADQVPRVLARAWDTGARGEAGSRARVGADGHPRRGPRCRGGARVARGEAGPEPRDRRGDRGRAAPGQATGPAGRRRHATGRGVRRASGRARGPPGRPQPHGYRHPAARPPAAARHDRVLGLAGREPAGRRGRRPARRRHPLPGDGQQQLGAGRDVPDPADPAHPRGHRPP